MTTYNSYEEAKIANPESDIYINEIGKYQCERGVLLATKKCNPADHCMTVEKFLVDGHKVSMGDVIINANGNVNNITQGDAKMINGEGGVTFNDTRYILRAAALKDSTDFQSSKSLVETLFDGFNRITAERDYDSAYDIACEMLDLEGETCSKNEKPKRTKIEYVKVTDSIFDLREEFERGELYHKSLDCSGNFLKTETEQLACGCISAGNLYRRIETEIDERQEFIEAACEVNEEVHGERRQYLIESLYDSGKFKLVEGE